ncbi:glycosyltransferase [Vibrio fluvialis]|nr:glycosyltransferase [Vibrio fluvialis]
MKNVLINLSNIHGGGAIQVAVSFLYELSMLDFKKISFNFKILASDEICNEINLLDVDLVNLNLECYNTYGLKTLLVNWRSKFSGYDLTFTLFGPGYFRVLRGKHLFGFAQSWIIYPENDCWKLMSCKDKILSKLKYSVQKLFFSRADSWIVELQHVKEGMVRTGLFEADKITVVPNCLSSVYFSTSSWSDIKFSLPTKELLLGIISRDYPHKNIDRLPDVSKILNEKGLPVKFVVTFNDSEWNKKDDYFRNSVINVGVLSSVDCPCFYKQLDGAIFPSLLESFSISPFEALMMELPLFASDRRFVRDACGDYAYYFEPTDVNSIVSVIYDYFTGRCDKYNAKEARQYVIDYSNPKSRAEMYVETIEDMLN